MAFDIRIVESNENEKTQKRLADEIERWSGIKWPPTNDLNYRRLLIKAGWSNTKIDSFFASTGTPGYGSIEKLPRPYISGTKDQPPHFTAALLEGLRINYRPPVPDESFSQFHECGNAKLPLNTTKNLVALSDTIFDNKTTTLDRFIKANPKRFGLERDKKLGSAFLKFENYAGKLRGNQYAYHWSVVKAFAKEVHNTDL